MTFVSGPKYQASVDNRRNPKPSQKNHGNWDSIGNSVKSNFSILVREVANSHKPTVNASTNEKTPSPRHRDLATGARDARLGSPLEGFTRLKLTGKGSCRDEAVANTLCPYPREPEAEGVRDLN